MKNRSKIIAFVISFMFASIAAFACDINFDVINGQKASYSQNDELTAKITVKFTHRSCPEGINKTELKPSGLEIAQATKWVETSAGVWERKLKLKVTANKGKAVLNAVRVCSKDGGKGSLSLPIK